MSTDTTPDPTTATQDGLHDLMWRTRLSALYHLKRERFLDGVDRAASAVATPLLLISGFTPADLASHTLLGAPLLRLGPPSIDQVCVLTGFAVLIVRTRLKEG